MLKTLLNASNIFLFVSGGELDEDDFVHFPFGRGIAFTSSTLKVQLFPDATHLSVISPPQLSSFLPSILLRNSKCKFKNSGSLIEEFLDKSCM